MFGIMQPEHGCSINRNDTSYFYHRQHYCGTCKTIGYQYSQVARFTLNFDAVFLAELLSDLLEEDTSCWDQRFQSVNQCFNLPNTKKNIPFSLAYAGTVNVFLAALKVSDHKADSTFGWGWQALELFFNRDFKRAQRQLQTWGVNYKELRILAKSQLQLEQATPTTKEQLGSFVAHYAEPTALITANLFAASMRQAGRPDLVSLFHQLGYQFGQLAYALDAAEDRVKDRCKGTFNPFAKFWEDCLSEDADKQIYMYVMDLKDQTYAMLEKLPLSNDRLEIYAGRLMTNTIKCLADKRLPAPTPLERVRLRWQTARHFAEKMTCKSEAISTITIAKQRLITLAVFMLPQISKQIENSTNIGWWGVIMAFSTILGLLLSTRTILHKKKERKRKCRKKRKKGWWHPQNWFSKSRKNKNSGCCSSVIFFVTASILGFLLLGTLVGIIAGGVYIYLGDYVLGWILYAVCFVFSIVGMGVLTSDLFRGFLCGDSGHCIPRQARSFFDIKSEMHIFKWIAYISISMSFIVCAVLGIVGALAAASISSWLVFALSILWLFLLSFYWFAGYLRNL